MKPTKNGPYSKLTINMSEGLLNIANSSFCAWPNATPWRTTMDALERRNLVRTVPGGWYELTAWGQARVAQIESDAVGRLLDGLDKLTREASA